MKDEIVTNEWQDANLCKPWARRRVLVRLSDGSYDVAYWCGMYWCTQCGRPYHNDGGNITHFYIFDRLIPKDYGN